MGLRNVLDVLVIEEVELVCFALVYATRPSYSSWPLRLLTELLLKRLELVVIMICLVVSGIVVTSGVFGAAVLDEAMSIVNVLGVASRSILVWQK